MNPETLTWQDLTHDNPGYFEIRRTPPGYPAPVEVPLAFRRRASSVIGTESVHRRAITYLLQHAGDPAIRLVHGQVTPEGEGEPRDLAWVELPGDIVLDPEVRDFFPAEAWREALHASVDQSYSREEAARLLLQTDHPGPWNSTDQP